MKSGKELDGSEFVDECQLDSDLQLYFSEEYVPTSSERMLLYRELDGLETDEQVEQFRKRMVDRFGPIPPEGEELIDVVRLRRLGKHFGSERIVLKNGRMRLFLVNKFDSPFYQGDVFGRMINFTFANGVICGMDVHKEHQCFYANNVNSVREAVQLLERMDKENGKLTS